MNARFFFGVAAAVCGTAAPAQTISTPAGNSEDVIIGAWSDPAKCNRANAIHLSFDSVLKQGEALKGKCVAVEGFWASRALFNRASQGNADGSNSGRSLRGRRIGVYARDQILQNAPRRAERYTMVGVVGQCETEWPDAMMVLGYCHYTGGSILKVSEVIPAQMSNVR